MPLRVGLNPYGLTATLGLLGAPAVVDAAGLPAFLAVARRIDARVVEIDWRWLVGRDVAALEGLGRSLAAEAREPIVSAWLSHEPEESLAAPIRLAQLVRASLVRLHLTPVLEGARSALGRRWPQLLQHARDTLARAAVEAARVDVRLGLENHQDLGSEELLELCQSLGPHVGIVFDTGNPFAVGEDPVAFARRVAGRVWHLHLKDYRSEFTTDGYRLVRCAIGDGAVPFTELVAVVAGPSTTLSASIEPAALEARHIRLFRPDWWQGYGPRRAAELATALGRLRAHQVAAGEDARTPWERQASLAEIQAYESAHLERSVQFVRRQSWSG